jgi:hypothetical protein
LKVIGDQDLGTVSPHDLGIVIGDHHAECHRRRINVDGILPYYFVINFE